VDSLLSFREAVSHVLALVGAVFDFLLRLKALIGEHFGSEGLIAAYLVVGVLTVVLLSKLVRLLIATVKYLVLPAVILAFVGSLFLPYSFTAILPVTASLCSLMLLAKA